MSKLNQSGHEAFVREVFARTKTKSAKLDFNKIAKKHKICRTTGPSLLKAGHIKKMSGNKFKWVGSKNPDVTSIVSEAREISNQYKYGDRKNQYKKRKTNAQRQATSPRAQNETTRKTIELAKRFATAGDIDFAHTLMDKAGK